MRTTVVILLALSLVHCVHRESSENRGVASDNCHETRAVFDVGSATTRLMVAEVDNCKLKILSVIKKEERSVGYKSDLETKSSREFSEELQTRGIAVFSELRAIATSAGASRFAGTATSAFRGALNSRAYLQRVKSETGIPIFVIEQSIEAKLGFLAAISQPGVNEESVVVWDIGGGSMQFSARENGEMVTSLVEMGSVGFKNEVLRRLQPQKALSDTPNPIGLRNFETVVSMAKQHALRYTEPRIKMLLEKRQVIGVGSVHVYSVLKQSGQTQMYDRSHVEAALRERLEFTDAQIGGAYAASDVTNLALILGYMEALGIESVQPLNVNLTNGTVLYPEFWQKN